MTPPWTSLAAALLVMVTLAGGFYPAMAGEPLRTAPGHLRPPADDELNADRLAPTRYAKLPQVVIREQKDWRKGGKMERPLTIACRAGTFSERRQMQFRAVFNDDVLGVAFGHGLNLFDPEHKAKADQIYLFHYAGTTACEVLSRPNGDPAAATSVVR